MRFLFVFVFLFHLIASINRYFVLKYQGWYEVFDFQLQGPDWIRAELSMATEVDSDFASLRMTLQKREKNICSVSKYINIKQALILL